MKMTWSHVLVRKLESKKKVVMADQGNIPCKGEVVAVGPGDYFGYPGFVPSRQEAVDLQNKKPNVIPGEITVVAPKDKVYFRRDGVMDVTIKGEKFYVMTARDILMVLTDDEAKD